MKKALAILLSVLLLMSAVPLGVLPALSVSAAQTVAINTDITVTITSGGQSVDLMFVPPASGYYTFYSGSSRDTYGYILNANKSTLRSDDDSGDGNNFRMEYYFTAGNTYYLRSRYYSSEYTGSFTVRIDGDVPPHDHLYFAPCDATCNVCGAVREADDHIYDDEADLTCNECGNARFLTYTISNNEVTITGYAADVPRDLVIPGTIEGYPVTTIGSYAFDNCFSLTSVTIPDSVTTIGNYAFYYCTSLTSVTIPDSVTSIGSDAFYCCTSLTSVYISDVAAWCNISFGNAYANPVCQSGNLYLNGNRVLHLEIPQGVTAIKNYAFYNCDSLWSVTIPDSVTSIGTYAFYDCYYLQSITIPDSVTSVGTYAFALCETLKEVHLGNGITTIPYRMFYKCDGLTSIVIPDSVTYIDDYAFYHCDSLQSVVIGDSVQYIDSYAFQYCDSLRYLSLPASVTNIYYYAFGGCYQLRDVYYGGTQDERWYISISYGNDYLNSATWLYGACFHQYDDVCDADCNVCGGVREPEHLYDADCNDADCNLCGAVRDVPAHIYDSSYDTTCNLCGAIRTVESIKIDEDIRIDISEDSGWVTLPFVPQESGYYFFDFSSSYAYGYLYDADGYTVGRLYDSESTMEVYLTAGETYSLSIGHRYGWADSFILHITYATQPHFRYLYTVTNQQATITGWQGTVPSKLVIPSAIDGYPVVAIGAGAFDYIDQLQSVVIPDSVTKIGNYAFQGCDNLTSIYLPDSVTTIGSRAFDSCYWLTDIYYAGDETAHWNIHVGEYNERFYEANWHYNACLHEYDNVCDDTCNNCGEVRENAHVFSDNCDRDCNICGLVRQAPHDYDGVCDNTCNVCDAQRKAEDHTYDNACDDTCNSCGRIRRVPSHVYDSVCDEMCNECGFIRNENIHVYDNVCDADCNLCGALRDAPAHIYDGVCDPECNRCGTLRETPEHVYSDACDFDCNFCGAMRTPPHVYTDDEDNECNVCGHLRNFAGFPDDMPLFVVDDAEAKAGETFTVAIRTKNNPGIISAKLSVHYDTWLLDLVDYYEVDFANVSYGPSWNYPFVVNWYNAVEPNNQTNGTLVLLTFRVNDWADAGYTSTIWVDYDYSDVFNSDWESVGFETVSGTVTVLETVYGDVNSDGIINNRDLALMQQYVNGWDVDVAIAACDVNGDRDINNRDLARLQQYLNNWGVTLG